MWEGRDTKELLDAKKQYMDKFGYNPDGEFPFWLMFKAMGFMLKFLLVPLIILGFIADDGKGVF